MTSTYKALLWGNRLEWLDEMPAEVSDNIALLVHITILQTGEGAKEEGSVGQRMATALERLAMLDDEASIEEPLQWERETRRDRPLPDR